MCQTCLEFASILAAVGSSSIIVVVAVAERHSAFAVCTHDSSFIAAHTICTAHKNMRTE
jgi:hypothetical protein